MFLVEYDTQKTYLDKNTFYENQRCEHSFCKAK
jgi:hypothetical protein